MVVCEEKHRWTTNHGQNKEIINKNINITTQLVGNF